MLTQYTHCIYQVWVRRQHSIHKSSESTLIHLDVNFRIVNLNKLGIGLEGGGDRSAVLQAKTIKDHCDVAALEQRNGPQFVIADDLHPKYPACFT